MAAMKVISWLLVCVVTWAAAELTDLDCPLSCSCSATTARCSDLHADMLFPGSITHLVLDSVPGLKLNLTKNFFMKIGLQQAASIKILNCSISYIDAGAFVGLDKLIEVTLSDNGLILIHPDTFANNSQLERLSLSGNFLQLTQLLVGGEQYFLKSNSLSELDLSRCQLSDIGKKLLSQVPNLQYISLRSNNITVIDDFIFEKVPLVDEVDLSNNLLISLNAEIFEDIEELTVLNLHNNMIENIDDFDIPGIKEIDLSYNDIKLLKKGAFENLADLYKLNISHNKITWISEEAFKDLEEIRHLDISHNLIMGPLPKYTFEKNEFLETLRLDGNKDINIFEGFDVYLPVLYYLDISDCGLTNITSSSFNNMPALAILNLSMNALTTLNHEIMSKPHRLNILDLSNNDISKVGTYTFASNSHLRKINLSNNKIHHLSANTFEATSSLTHLDLSNNQFHHVWYANDSDYMKENKFLSQLEYLNIAGNKIKYFHKKDFGHLTSLKSIDFRNNPIECTSEFPVFIEWLYASNVQPADLGQSATFKGSEKKNLQWDPILMDVCKSKSEEIEIKIKPEKEDVEVEKAQDINLYEYTVIEDVKLAGQTDNEFEESIAVNELEKEKISEEINTYVWPTFLVVFALVFFSLAICNTAVLLICRHRNHYGTPFKRTVVRLDNTPRYHKLYEECSVPNTPIVKGNLLENLVSSQIKLTGPSKTKSDEVV